MKRILIDSFFHNMPGHRLSRNITTAGYVINVGRYSPHDVYHPNGLSMLYNDLCAKYDVEYLNETFSEMSLCSADLLIVPNPDYPGYEGAAANRLDHDDVDAMMNFMERGGQILMLVNSFLQRSDFWEENFDYERVSPLFRRLGVTWDPDYMSDDERMLPAAYKDMTVGYGQGGKIEGKVPEDVEVLLSCEGLDLGFYKKVGRGGIAVVGDAGSVSNGLYGFPTFDNKAFITDLIDRMIGGEEKQAESFEEMHYGMLSCATSNGGIPEEMFKNMLPGAKYIVDHHYRHQVWEDEKKTVTASEVKLPFALEEIRDAEEIEITVPYICYGKTAAKGTVTVKAHVDKKISKAGEEYFVSGNRFEEDAQWDCCCEDPEAFKERSVLTRLNTVLQYTLGVKNGKLQWANARHGQVAYGKSSDAHYGGFSVIILGSDCCAYGPVAE